MLSWVYLSCFLLQNMVACNLVKIFRCFTKQRTANRQNLEARRTCWSWFSSLPRSTLESNKKRRKKNPNKLNCLRPLQHINSSISPPLIYMSLSSSGDDMAQSQRLMYGICSLHSSFEMQFSNHICT